MLAVKFVDVAIVGGMVLGAVPPIPVAAFGNQEFFVGELALGLHALRSSMMVGFASLEEIVPGAVVFRSADPDIEVGRDPGARGDRIQTVEVVMPRDRFRDGYGFYPWSVLQRVVETAQEFAARLGIVFPGVFAIE